MHEKLPSFRRQSELACTHGGTYIVFTLYSNTNKNGDSYEKQTNRPVKNLTYAFTGIRRMSLIIFDILYNT